MTEPIKKFETETGVYVVKPGRARLEEIVKVVHRPLEGPVEPLAEGDWQLNEDDKVGED